MKDVDMDNNEDSSESERRVQAIIQSAGARPKPDPFRKNADRAKLKKVWSEEVQKQRRSRFWKMGAPIGIAATVVLSMLIGLPRLGGVEEDLGEILLIQGEVTHTSIEGEAANQHIYAGDVLASKLDGSATIQLNDQTVVQLAHSTQITIHGESDIWLHTGRVFVDSPGFDSHIVIRSSWGEIRDIGTQFEVNIGDDFLELAMREGIAEINLAGSTSDLIVAKSNEKSGDLVLVETGNEVTRTSLDRSAKRWSWTRSGAPDYPAGDTSLALIVQWAARQTGREIEYESPLAVLQLKNERVVWPAIKVQTLETQLSELSESSGFHIEFSDDAIQVFMRR